MLRVKEKLQDSLKKMFTLLFEGTTEDKETVLNSIYTPLYITDGESEWVNREHEIRQIESLQKASATPINCNDIFNPRPGQKRRIRCLLTKGIAGIGKTVSVHKFILDWAEGKANQDIDFIFALPFRELNLIPGEHSLHELLCNFHPELEQITAKMFASCRVLFIFDGLDESRLPFKFSENKRLREVTETSSVDVLLTNLIRGHLLPNALIWVTTRPAAANKIERTCINQMTEVRGFTDQQKEEYFMKQFSENENLANKIIEYITRTRSLFIMCYIPIMCYIIAKVLECTFSGNETEEIPTTLTEMYIGFLITQTEMRDKYEVKKEKITERILQSSKDLILKLAQLAFQQLLKGNLIFYEVDLNNCGIDVNEATVKSGFCTEFLTVQRGLHKRKVHSFVHLSFQEFLAALYVFDCCVRKNINALESLLENVSIELPLHEMLKRVVYKALQTENGDLDMFMRFLVGFSLESNQTLLQGLLPQTESSSETVEEMSRYLRMPDVENISVERQVNLFHCLIEMRDIKVHEEIHKYFVSTDRDALSEHHCSALANAILMSQGVVDDMDLRKYNISWCNRLIPAVRKSRNSVLANMRLISTEDCASLASSLQSPDSHLRGLHLWNLDEHHDCTLSVVCAALSGPLCKLRLTNMLLSTEDYESLASTLQSPDCPLRELHLERIAHRPNQYQSIVYGPVVSAALRGLYCKLESLRLTDMVLSTENCESLASSLQSRNCPLRELYLESIDHHENLSIVYAALGGLHCTLDKLTLKRCSLTENRCGELASFLSSNVHLRELDLSHNDLQDSGVRLLSDGLKSPRCRLKIMRLPFCRVTEQGCAALASALRSNPSHLRELDLSFNHPGDTGVKLLSDPLCRMEKLIVEPNEEIWVNPQLLKNYACDVTLDPNSAHRDILLMDPFFRDHPERFDKMHQVLCREGLNGRHYWEAKGEVVDKIGVTYSSIRRKGTSPACCFGKNDKSWVLAFYGGQRLTLSVIHNNEETFLPLWLPLSSRVGVYLDWPAGILSFYSISDTKSVHLYTFHTTFTETLYPAITSGLNKPRLPRHLRFFSCDPMAPYSFDLNDEDDPIRALIRAITHDN